jgi:macrolide-specific efflux system membrane fusion protein
MTARTTRPWLNYLLGVACVGAIVAAFLVVGPASGSQSAVTRTATAAQGVVQSTVSGSGNLAAASQLDLGFKTSGTVTNIYVSQGQHVTEGQLLATLNPESAEVALEQSRATLQSAIANLAQEEENDGETSTGQSTGQNTGGQGSGGSTANAAYVTSTPTPTTTSPATTSPNNTSPATTSPNETTKPTKKEHETTTETGGSSSSSSTSSSNSSTTSKPTESAATREANLASARAAVNSDKLTVQSDEEAVQNTKLYAPEDGTIVSLSGQVGETVSGGGTTKASSSSSSSSGGSGTGTGAAGGVSAAGAGAGSSSSSSKSSDSSSSSSSSFAILSDLSSMQLVVPLSESEIGNVKAGQPATVTVEALGGAKLAAHVSEVALLSTSSSGGAVSYDVTFQLDQLEAGLKVGMSATAEVVVKQAEGVNVPTSAISAGSVTVKRNGREVRQRVVTGLAGNTSTIVLSGLRAGETVVLPAASTTGSSATNLLSKLGSRAGGGGLGGGGIGGGAGIGGGGGGAFFRGGG